MTRSKEINPPFRPRSIRDASCQLQNTNCSHPAVEGPTGGWNSSVVKIRFGRFFLAYRSLLFCSLPLAPLPTLDSRTAAPVGRLPNFPHLNYPRRLGSQPLPPHVWRALRSPGKWRGSYHPCQRYHALQHTPLKASQRRSRRHCGTQRRRQRQQTAQKTISSHLSPTS